MLNERGDRLPNLKQHLETAQTIADTLGPLVNVYFREGLLTQIESEERESGKLSLEFVQGLFSGVALAESLVRLVFKDDPQKCLQMLSVALAQIYAARAEEQIRNATDESK